MHQCSRNARLLTEGLTILLWLTPHTGTLLLGTLDMYFFSSNILGKKITAFSLYTINRPPPPTQSPETISRDHGSYSLRWEILHKCRGARWKKNVWEFTHGDGRIVNGDESPDPHSWRSQRKKSLVFCGSKNTMECMRPITHELPISHHCIAFSVSFFFNWNLVWRFEFIWIIFS